MFKLPQNCTHFTCQQGNDQNPSSQASAVHELRTRCTSWIQKRQRNQRSNCHICRIMEKARDFQKNIYFCFIDYAKAFDCVYQNKLWKMLQETAIPDHLTCLLRNQYASQEAKIRTRQGINDWLNTGQGVCQGCILSSCLFTLYADYIMRNSGLEEAQAGIKIVRRNIYNLRYADDTILMAESEELKSSS